MSNYKFDIGDYVYLNDSAFASLPKKNRMQLPTTFRSNIFSVAKQKNEAGTNWYFMPGYDWQGGTGWVTESWLTKWCGGGPLRLSVEIMPEQDDTMKDLHDFQQRILASMRIPANMIGTIDFTYAETPKAKLDKKVG
jgi:hypothetical protein